MGYKHISYSDRIVIENLLIIGESRKKIAEAINKHPSTISREIQRNAEFTSYRAEIAQKKSARRRNIS